MKPLCVSTPVWENKPLLENSLLVWDSDNISVSALDMIQHLAKITPHKRYAISKKPLSKDNEARLLKEGFIILASYPHPTDATIVQLIDSYHHHSSYLIFISSDGDFIPVINRFLHTHPVQWMMQDCNKKRICMYINLTQTAS